MSNLIPPLLSSSPPPIVGPLDEEDDDEFGDFRAAADSFDCDDISLPPSPQKSEVNLDINSNKSQKSATEMPTEDLNESIVEKDFQDRRKSVDDEVQPEIKVNSSEQIDEINGFEVDCEEKVEEKEDFVVPNENSLSEANSESNEIKSDYFSEEINDKEENLSESSVSLKVSETEQKSTEDDFGDFENHFNNEKDDEFDDFVETHFNNEKEDEFDEFIEASQNDAEDDFGDFESSDFGEFSQSCEKPTFLEIDPKNSLEKSEIILKEIFPVIEEEILDFIPIDYTTENRIFEELKDVAETNALIYQWAKSNSQKMFLKSLNIDTRNILYGPAWNSSMPRFAGLTPLEPVKTEILTPTPVQNVSSPSNSSQKETSDIPTVQFDWNGSGLVNPLDSTSTELPVNVPEESSQPQNPQEFLPPKSDPIPSLFESDIINSKEMTETEKPTDFSPFQSPKLIPLRETHISNDQPGWLQPTILTPDLPRKEPIIEPDEDEFDDFQMVLPEENKTVSELTKNQHISEPSDEEFTEFHASLPPQNPVFEPLKTVPLEPLKPVPLEPLKPVRLEPSEPRVTQINWPDPGVTDEDIKNIELAYSRKEDDDEWSDFVSVTKPVMPDRTATPDLPLSVLNLNSVQAPKQPIPVITPSGLVQTKLSSNLGHQSVVQTSVQPMFRPPINQFQPSIISNQFAANFPSASQDDDDDDWSDFVSSQPQPQPQVNGYQKTATNIIMNPMNYATPKNRNPISTIPDLDFIAPKNRTKK